MSVVTKMSRHCIEKVALITGSRQGIGYQTALQLASRKWILLIADKYELEAAKHEIVTRTSNSKIFPYYLNLSCFKSVRTFANAIKQHHDRIDVLINNAGIFSSQEERTIDDLNCVWQVNHLGPFLLTVLLTDLLKKSAPSRVIFLASSGAFLHSLNPHQIPNMKENCASNMLEPALTYYNSKLCNMIVCKEFANKLRKHNVTSICLHPGMTNSNFLINECRLKWLSPMAHKLIGLFTQDTEKAAQMVTFLATSQATAHITGKYFVNYQVSRYPKILEDVYFRTQLWKQAEDLVNLTTAEKLFYE